MVHDAVPWHRPETMGRGAAIWFRGFHRLAARRGAHVAAPTAAALHDVGSTLGLPGSRLHVVGNAIAPWLDVTTPAARPAIAGEGPYVLSVCRIEPRKDLATLLDAWEAVRAERPDLRLLLAGKAGWKVDALIDRAKRVPGVELLGAVASGDLPGLYAHATAFVSTSREEGFGLPVLEAMALGAPVVASAIGAHEEVAGTAARMFTAGDAAACADALRAVVSDSDVAESLRRAGRERAELWSTRRLGDRLLAALHATVASADA
jgi:glycosyltransferase involved in cell wall biosynthesis